MDTRERRGVADGKGEGGMKCVGKEYMEEGYG